MDEATRDLIGFLSEVSGCGSSAWTAVRSMNRWTRRGAADRVKSNLNGAVARIVIERVRIRTTQEVERRAVESKAAWQK